MVRSLPILAIAFLLSGTASGSLQKSCRLPGELLQWQLDYCLMETGTDDVIAASPCMERESHSYFRRSCEGKFHYKRAMCVQAVRTGSRSGTVQSCVQDPSFMGSAVRNHGV